MDVSGADFVLCTQALSIEDRKRRNELILQEGGFQLDIGRNFLTVRMDKHWNSLPKGTVETLSLEVLNAG